MKIPLPKMMRHWREREFERGLNPVAMRSGLGLWAFMAKRPALYHALSAIGMPLLSALSGKKRRFGWLPLAGGWTRHRELPAPQGKTFMQQVRNSRPAAAR